MNPVRYYSQESIKNAIKEIAEDREIAVKFGEKGFGKRPDVISYANDVVEMAKQGATSFHMSEERWLNPLHLLPNMNRQQLNHNRIGWDLIIDIDTKLEYSKITAELFIKAIKHHGIRNVTCKFSGNKGFHIAVPFEAFPEKVYGIDIKDWFPEGPKAIALYLKEFVRKHLVKRLDEYGIQEIKKDFPDKKIIVDGMIDPYSFIEIDTLLISPRHMIRMPYSLHEKSGLVSLPIDPEKVISFEIESARPENIRFDYPFLKREGINKNEARMLFVQALDSQTGLQTDLTRKNFYDEKQKKEQSYDALNEKIPESFFPPCIKYILNGLKDGRKRSIFILIKFLSSVGWSYKEIEELLYEWNKRNFEPLSETIIKSHLNYHKRNYKKALPPNCDKKEYYLDMQACHPDNFCQRIKNPVQYAKFLYKMSKQDDEKPRRRKKKDEISEGDY